MPYVKAVPLSRIAGSALKSFTHGYAQTVVAASQSSYAAQNAPGPLAETLIGRIRKAEKSRVQNVYRDVEGVRQASTASAAAGRPESGHPDAGLEKYFDAWQKQQRSGGTKEWNQFQFARRLEWQPPSTVPAQALEAEGAAATQQPVEIPESRDELPVAAPTLKRSYTTSALNDFSKAFVNDEVAEADVVDQFKNALTEESLRSKDEAEEALTLKAPSSSPVSHEQTLSTPPTAYTPTSSFTVTPEAEIYSIELLRLADTKQYERVPAAFQSMLRAGVQQPAPAAYRALLNSAIELTKGKHQKVPKALEVYSDMLRRKVQPDTETFSTLINLLATRASESISMRSSLEDRLARYGGLQQPGKFMFRSAEAEHSMLLEDWSLAIALKVFDRAVQLGRRRLSSESCAALITACAEHGRLDDAIRIHRHMQLSGTPAVSNIYPPVIAAFGATGDLKGAVDFYDEYKELCIAHNAGETEITRIDNDVYAAVVKAYGSVDRLKGGLKFLASVQAAMPNEKELLELREVVGMQALLPLALQDKTFKNGLDLVNSLSGRALNTALASIASAAADRGLRDIAQKAFDALAKLTKDLASPAMAMLAMHIRNANVEAAESFWRILESAPVNTSFIEPTTMWAVALIGVGQSERGLRQARRMFSRIRDQQRESSMMEAVEQVDEALELMGHFVLSAPVMQHQAGSELLRMMAENGGLLTPLADHIMARFGAEQIARLSPADLEFVLRVQSDMVLHEAVSDIAGPARFGCMLENIVAKSIMPSAETATAIEKTLINIDRNDLSRLWNSYRYPQPTPVATPFSPVGSTPLFAPSFDDSFDPYAARTDVKGSNVINDMLEHGRRTNEAMTKFKNMRRVGRVPRMFTYGKLIESAAKENNLALAHDILEMAKQDVPFDARYRVVRFGWQQILDHMVAGCLTIGRRDLASRFHQDLLDMGAAPSANTYGLYITTLKENTKTFDEASEAVKIFLRAKSEGVEPSSFLYNALIGKLGKARRIDDALFYFAEMRNLGIKPTSVTYGTIVNALCRVSDEKFAEEIFEEMESAVNYKPRPAPYHSLMQFFLTTKRDKGKVLSYYERMRSKGIEPTAHTYKLLIDTHATLEPINLDAAEKVLAGMQSEGVQPEAVHYASLIHAKGCVLHDLAGARQLFDNVVSAGKLRLQPCIYQALFESLNANHAVSAEVIDPLVADMQRKGVEFTPYIANALIHGWTLEKDIGRAAHVFARVPMGNREPSTYEAMVRAYLAAEKREDAKLVVREALGRGYPAAVAARISELVR